MARPSIFRWGTVISAISRIDNIVKPHLISRTSSLPLLVIVFGVFGGVIAFGLMGVFIGPALLAVALTLVRAGWRDRVECCAAAFHHPASFSARQHFLRCCQRLTT